MFFKMLSLGNMDNNCYIIGDEKSRQAAVIDAPCDAAAILDVLEEENLTLKYILLTHAHYDHIGALDALHEATDAQVLIHHFEEDAVCDPAVNLSAYAEGVCPKTAPTRTVADNETLHVGDIDIKVYYTPGHTVGSVCYYTEGMLFSGDTLFLRNVGRCDLPGGDFDIIKESIRRQLYILPDDTDVYPGHGRTTTIGYEKQHNEYIQQDWEYEY